MRIDYRRPRCVHFVAKVLVTKSHKIVRLSNAASRRRNERNFFEHSGERLDGKRVSYTPLMARPSHLPPEPVQTEKDGVKLVSLGDAVATIYRCNNNGYPQYRVSCRAGLKRLRLTRSDEKEAIEEAKRMVKSVAAGKVDLASTPLREIEEWTALKEEAGGDLRVLRTALEEYKRRNPDDLKNRTTREVVDEFIENQKLRRERRKKNGQSSIHRDTSKQARPVRRRFSKKDSRDHHRTNRKFPAWE